MDAQDQQPDDGPYWRSKKPSPLIWAEHPCWQGIYTNAEQTKIPTCVRFGQLIMSQNIIISLSERINSWISKNLTFWKMSKVREPVSILVNQSCPQSSQVFCTQFLFKELLKLTRVKSFFLCPIGPHILCRTGPLWCCAAERRNNICGPMWHNKKDFTLGRK